MVYTPAYLASDLPLIVADGAGTAGAATVSLIPLAVAAGAIYVGVKATKGAYNKGKGWKKESYRHSLARKGIKTKR